MDLGFVEFALGIAIIIFAASLAKHWLPAKLGVTSRRAGRETSAVAYQVPPQITAKALETYERLAKEKLEVIKTALAMGYKDDDLAALDARLERLVGRDKLAEILQGSGAAAMASADLLDTQLDHEVERLRDLRQKTPR